jgi:iron(III) transport system substrate-binding protein
MKFPLTRRTKLVSQDLPQRSAGVDAKSPFQGEMCMYQRLFSGMMILMSVLLVACQQAAAPVEVTRVVTETQEVEVTRLVTEPTVEAETPAEAADPGSLVIYSGRSESLVQPVINQFQEATGIQVEVRYGSTPEITGVLLEEGANSPADVFFAQDPGGLGSVAAAGMLAQLPEELLSQVPPRFASPDGDWIGISGRARVVVYHTEAIGDPAAELPPDIFDFVDPQWTGRIGWAPTNGSFQAMVTAMRVMWGEERTAEWLQGIQANNPVVFDGNAPIVEAVGRGEIDVGLVNHYYLYRYLAEQGEAFPARNYFLPGGGPGSLIMVSGAGILNTASNAENAMRFLEFLLSVPGQQYFVSQTHEYPVIEGVATPPLLPPFADLDALAPDIALDDLADVQGTQDLLIELGIIE